MRESFFIHVRGFLISIGHSSSSSDRRPGPPARRIAQLLQPLAHGPDKLRAQMRRGFILRQARPHLPPPSACARESAASAAHTEARGSGAVKITSGARWP